MKPMQPSTNGSTTITALIVVGIVAIAASGLAWKQHLEIRQLENIRDQVQIGWLQKNVVDFARVILKDDLRQNAGIDHLGEIWALPLQDSKIADFLKSKDLPDEIDSISLKAHLTDAQSMFNLTNLWGANNAGLPDVDAIKVYVNLLNQLGLDGQLANQTVNIALRSKSKPTQIDDLLTYPGYSKEILAKIRPFVTVLPQTTPVNINTCSSEVLLAIDSFLTRSDVDGLLQSRTTIPFSSVDDINKRVNQVRPNVANPTINPLLDVKSNYWIAYSEIQMRQRLFNNQTLISRSDTLLSGGNLTQIIWSKQYLSQLQ
jgi:general secretion pathway protein K